MTSQRKKWIAILCAAALTVQFVPAAVISEAVEPAVAELPAETVAPETESVPEEMISASAEEILTEENYPEEVPVQEVSAEETPVEEAPAEEVPAEEVSVEEIPKDEISDEEMPAEEAPVEEVPAEEVPAEEVSVEEIPTGEISDEEMPAEEIPVEEVSAEEVTVEEVSVEEIPTGEISDEEMPAEEAPAEEVPAEEVPAEEVPEEEVPAEEVSVEEVPAEEIRPDRTQKGTGAVQCSVTGGKPWILRFIPEKTEELTVRIQADHPFKAALQEENSNKVRNESSDENHQIIISSSVRNNQPLLLILKTTASFTIAVEFDSKEEAAETEKAMDDAPVAEENQDIAEINTAEQESAQEPAEEAGEKELLTEAEQAETGAQNDSPAETEAPEESEAAPEEQEAPAAETEEEIAADSGEESSDRVEVIVNKAVKPGDTWEGAVKNTKPAVLKLDVDQPGTIYVVAESKQILWAAAVKSDRPNANPAKSFSDQENGTLVLPLQAEQGSYLIEIASESPEHFVRVTVRFLNGDEYTAWAAEQGMEKEQEEAGEPEAYPEEPEFILPENRSVHIDMTWDTNDPQIGDTAHFTSVITGYDNLVYTLPWQISRDQEVWTDYAGATEPQLDVVLTEETEGAFFRLVVYVENKHKTE